MNKILYSKRFMELANYVVIDGEIAKDYPKDISTEDVMNLILNYENIAVQINRTLHIYTTPVLAKNYVDEIKKLSAYGTPNLVLHVKGREVGRDYEYEDETYINCAYIVNNKLISDPFLLQIIEASGLDIHIDKMNNIKLIKKLALAEIKKYRRESIIRSWEQSPERMGR